MDMGVTVKQPGVTVKQPGHVPTFVITFQYFKNTLKANTTKCLFSISTLFCQDDKVLYKL